MRTRSAVIAAGMVGARQAGSRRPIAPSPCPPVAVEPDAGPDAGPPSPSTSCPACRSAPLPTLCAAKRRRSPASRAFPGLLAPSAYTHTKWASIRDGRVHAFRTLMTGEMFDPLDPLGPAPFAGGRGHRHGRLCPEGLRLRARTCRCTCFRCAPKACWARPTPSRCACARGCQPTDGQGTDRRPPTVARARDRRRRQHRA